MVCIRKAAFAHLWGMDLLEAPTRQSDTAVRALSAPRKVARRAVDPSNGLALYLRDISLVPLLSAEDEVRLARDIEVGVLAAERLASAPHLSADDRADLAILAEQGERSKAVLIESNLRLVVSLAKRYHGCGTAMLDLIQEGNIGLMRAVEKFDHRRGFKFSTYARGGSDRRSPAGTATRDAPSGCRSTWSRRSTASGRSSER